MTGVERLLKQMFLLLFNEKYKKVIIALNYSEMMYNDCTNTAEFNAISSRDKLFQMDITYSF